MPRPIVVRPALLTNINNTSPAQIAQRRQGSASGSVDIMGTKS
jgi:hypothetical protein